MRRIVGYTLIALGMILSEIAHQTIHVAEWCLDHDGRIDCPNCVREP